jgi:hypothetical protein
MSTGQGRARGRAQGWLHSTWPAAAQHAPGRLLHALLCYATAWSMHLHALHPSCAATHSSSGLCQPAAHAPFMLALHCRHPHPPVAARLPTSAVQHASMQHSAWSAERCRARAVCSRPRRLSAGQATTLDSSSQHQPATAAPSNSSSPCTEEQAVGWQAPATSWPAVSKQHEQACS